MKSTLALFALLAGNASAFYSAGSYSQTHDAYDNQDTIISTDFNNKAKTYKFYFEASGSVNPWASGTGCLSTDRFCGYYARSIAKDFDLDASARSVALRTACFAASMASSAIDGYYGAAGSLDVTVKKGAVRNIQLDASAGAAAVAYGAASGSARTRYRSLVVTKADSGVDLTKRAAIAASSGFARSVSRAVATTSTASAAASSTENLSSVAIKGRAIKKFTGAVTVKASAFTDSYQSSSTSTYTSVFSQIYTQAWSKFCFLFFCFPIIDSASAIAQRYASAYAEEISNSLANLELKFVFETTVAVQDGLVKVDFDRKGAISGFGGTSCRAIAYSSNNGDATATDSTPDKVALDADP